GLLLLVVPGAGGEVIVGGPAPVGVLGTDAEALARRRGVPEHAHRQLAALRPAADARPDREGHADREDLDVAGPEEEIVGPGQHALPADDAADQPGWRTRPVPAVLLVLLVAGVR